MCIAHLPTAGQVKKEVVAWLPNCNDATTLIIHWRKREKFCCDTEEGEWIISTLLLLTSFLLSFHVPSLLLTSFAPFQGILFWCCTPPLPHSHILSHSGSGPSMHTESGKKAFPRLRDLASKGKGESRNLFAGLCIVHIRIELGFTFEVTWCPVPLILCLSLLSLSG